MTIAVTPHLNFRGSAREALEFYRDAFGGELTTISYADMGNTDPQTADHVVWGQVSAPNGFRVMAYDVYPHLPWDQGADPFFVSVRGTDPAELRRFWQKLGEGATGRPPREPAPWAPRGGQRSGRFGGTWVLDIAAAYPES